MTYRIKQVHATLKPHSHFLQYFGHERKYDKALLPSLGGVSTGNSVPTIHLQHNWKRTPCVCVCVCVCERNAQLRGQVVPCSE